MKNVMILFFLVCILLGVATFCATKEDLKVKSSGAAYLVQNTLEDYNIRWMYKNYEITKSYQNGTLTYNVRSRSSSEIMPYKDKDKIVLEFLEHEVKRSQRQLEEYKESK